MESRVRFQKTLFKDESDLTFGWSVTSFLLIKTVANKTVSGSLTKPKRFVEPIVSRSERTELRGTASLDWAIAPCRVNHNAWRCRIFSLHTYVQLRARADLWRAFEANEEDWKAGETGGWAKSRREAQADEIEGSVVEAERRRLGRSRHRGWFGWQTVPARSRTWRFRSARQRPCFRVDGNGIAVFKPRLYFNKIEIHGFPSSVSV